MKQIFVLHTGGTIAMKENPTTGSRPRRKKSINRCTDSPSRKRPFDHRKYFHLSSPHITPEHMLKIKERIQKTS